MKRRTHRIGRIEMRYRFSALILLRNYEMRANEKLLAMVPG
jgi:hypothetical protein